jgi:hypothetical protein
MINKIFKIFGTLFASFFLIAGSTFAVGFTPSTFTIGDETTNLLLTIGNGGLLFDTTGQFYGEINPYNGDMGGTVYGDSGYWQESSGLDFSPTIPGNYTYIELNTNFADWVGSGYWENTSDNLDLSTLTLSQLQTLYPNDILSINTLNLINSLQPATAIFSFIDASSSNATGANLSAVLIPAVSSLWPIVLIIAGILLTFYVIDRIIYIFCPQ